MTVSVQKVGAILRQAGLPASRWHASRRVRGWKTLMQEGFAVRKRHDDRVEITYDCIFRIGADGKLATKIDEAAQVVRAAGLAVEREAHIHRLIVG